MDGKPVELGLAVVVGDSVSVGLGGEDTGLLTRVDEERSVAGSTGIIVLEAVTCEVIVSLALCAGTETVAVAGGSEGASSVDALLLSCAVEGCGGGGGGPTLVSTATVDEACESI